MREPENTNSEPNSSPRKPTLDDICKMLGQAQVGVRRPTRHPPSRPPCRRSTRNPPEHTPPRPTSDLASARAPHLASGHGGGF